MIGGTEQDQRPLAVLETHRFAVDGLQLDQLVALCARLAARLRFVDLNDQEDGDWRGLFERDESLVLAGIASFDRFQRQRTLTRLCDHAPLERIADEVLDLADLLDGWHHALAEQPSATAVEVRDTVQRMAQGHLARQLAWMLEHFDTVPPAGAMLRRRHAGLQPVLWHDGQAAASVAAAMQTAPRQRLRAIVFSFLHALQRVQLQARAGLPQTLDSGHHEPAAGLLLGFLQLYASVQQDVNRFAARHVDFYYREVLGLSERAARPDRAHVVGLPEPQRTATPLIAAGALFAAGKDEGGRPVTFRALNALAVNDVRVAALATLRQQREQAIAPECKLGFVSGVRSRWLGLPGPDAAPSPIFGGGTGSRDARLGFALASPLLALAEGERSIEIELTLDWGGEPLDTLLRTAFDAGEAAQEARPGSAEAVPATEAFRQALGRLFAGWLLGSTRTLARQDCERLFELGQALDAGGSVLADMCGLRRAAADGARYFDPEPARELAFFKYLGDLFEVSVTTADGWLAAERVQLRLPRDGGGLRLHVPLRVDHPPVCGCDPAVHGPEWPTRLPLLRLDVSPRARVYPVSLLESANLRQVRVRVGARGVRSLLLQNNLGPLDASKPFAPFGPLPSTASYLVLGAPEAATKNLESLTVQLQWSGLPPDAGGFATHYAGYGPALAAGRFTVALSLLQAGVWRACGGQSARQPLFGTPDADGRLGARQSIIVDPVSVREFANGGSAPLESVAGARDGLLSLRLNDPPAAFGHAAYPSLLSDALSRSHRLRRRPPLPRPPYTPELETISIDYQASSLLNLARPGAADGGDVERLLHIHPFGVAELYADGGRRRFGLLPRLGPDGSLAIGLDAPAGLGGPLTLLFQLQSAGAAELRPGARRPPVRWDYLVQDRWQPLEARHLLSDTTFGMLCSGVVTLDLPEGPTRDNSVLGRDGLYWLRASCASLLDTAAPLVSVHAQALTLERVPVDAAAAATPVPAGTITEPLQRVPGLAGMRQIGPSSGLRAAEDATALRTRAGERLRHKNRASLAWDYERLVLEHFDRVRKVRCFMAPAAGLGAGQVLVVVVPRVATGEPGYATAAARLDTGVLQDIHEMLAERASPFVQLAVRNAAYERVQARCQVRFKPKAQAGEVRREVNRVVTELLSPWTADGPGPQLEWELRCETLELRLRKIDGVDGVGGLSLLHVVRDDDGHYTLGDTARAERQQLRHAHPWSLALPLDHHLIETGAAPDTADALGPAPADLTALEVGRTFVVGPPAAPPLRAAAPPAPPPDLPTLETLWGAG